MLNELLGLVKNAASAQIKTEKPASIIGGTVVSVEPLKIQIDQKRTLTESFLVLTKSVVDYSVDFTVDHTTEAYTHTHKITDTYSSGGSASRDTHVHSYQGTKKFIIHNKLKVGDAVILLQVQGGKKYVVIDVIGGGCL